MKHPVEPVRDPNPDPHRSGFTCADLSASDPSGGINESHESWGEAARARAPERKLAGGRGRGQLVERKWSTALEVS